MFKWILCSSVFFWETAGKNQLSRCGNPIVRYLRFILSQSIFENKIAAMRNKYNLKFIFCR